MSELETRTFSHLVGSVASKAASAPDICFPLAANEMMSEIWFKFESQKNWFYGWSQMTFERFTVRIQKPWTLWFDFDISHCAATNQTWHETARKPNKWYQASNRRLTVIFLLLVSSFFVTEVEIWVIIERRISFQWLQTRLTFVTSSVVARSTVCVVHNTCLRTAVLARYLAKKAVDSTGSVPECYIPWKKWIFSKGRQGQDLFRQRKCLSLTYAK